MSDPGPLARPIPTADDRRDRLGVWALSLTLVIVVVLQGALAVALFTLQVHDWSLANKLLDHLAQLDVLLAGGLLALVRPGRTDGI